MIEKIIDINYDFRKDTDEGKDPDSYSKILQEYHQILWSKILPNGQSMDLEIGSPNWDYLKWEDFRFGSDSIINMYMHQEIKYIKGLIIELKEFLKNKNIDFDKFKEEYYKKSYTIGGFLIFPRNGQNSINTVRGSNSGIIKDRIDLTLECIRRFYLNEQSPLFNVLNEAKNKKFFNLFIDFKGYVDFFYLQDLVSDDYKSIKFFLDFDNFKSNGYPKDAEEWFELYEKQMKFLEKRNQRIKKKLKNYMK